MYLDVDRLAIRTDGGAPAVTVMTAVAVAFRSSLATKTTKRYWLPALSEFAGIVKFPVAGIWRYPLAQYGKFAGS